jgi:hypothetical protein
MRDPILTARYIFFEEVLLEKVPWHILDHILAKVDECLPLNPVSRLT